MKTNAIVRICIYTVLILFLAGLLAVVLMGWNPFAGNRLKTEPVATTPDGEVLWDQEILPEGETAPILIPADEAGIVTCQLNVHRSPSEQTASVGTLSPGDRINILKYRVSNGITWGYITSPVEGWVCTDYLDMEQDLPEATASREGFEATVNSPVNVRNSPTDQAGVAGMLYPGDIITISEIQHVQGVQWGHVDFPVNGWVNMDFVDMEQGLPEAPSADGDLFTAISKVNVRTTPSRQGTVLGNLEPGEQITIDEVQTALGVDWGHITFPFPGWVCMDYVEAASQSEVEQNAIVEATAAEIPQEEALDTAVLENGIPADGISRISIDWAAGDINIRRGSPDNNIYISEDAPDGANPMVLNVKDGRRLDIKFQERKSAVSFGIGSMDSKDLTITIPRDFDMKELEIDMASGNVRLRNLVIGELDLDCADVTVEVETCEVGSMEVDTASGDVTFSGRLEELDIDSASSDFVGVFDNTPRRIDMDGMSGSLDITLPKDTGFTAKVEGLSNNFTSDFPTTTVNGAHTHGNGTCRITVDGMSGDVTIRKGSK